VAANAAVNQALWIAKLLADLHMEQKYSTKIFVDNQAAISISSNQLSWQNRTFQDKVLFSKGGTKGRRSEINLLQNRRTQHRYHKYLFSSSSVIFLFLSSSQKSL